MKLQEEYKKFFRKKNNRQGLIIMCTNIKKCFYHK